MRHSPLLALALAASCGDKDDTADTPVTDDTSVTDDTADDTSAPQVRWEAAFDTSATGSLSGVWGSGPDDVWIVGGDDEGGEVHHYDGAAWSPVDIPEVPLLVWVHGFGPDDAWTVGVDGAAMHWDGAAWTVVDTGTTEDLWGVFGFAPDDLWVVGGDPDVGEPLILHWDGEAFAAVPLDPAQNTHRATTLFKVWGIGSKLFIVGQNGQILRWDGAAWVDAPGGANANQDFVSLWGTSEDNIVAVGGRGNARVAEYDGTAWTTYAPSGFGGVNAVHMAEPGQAVIGGIYGFTGTWDLATDTITRDDPATSVDVHAIWGDGQGRHYAVGGTFLAPHRGAALVRTVEAR